MMSKLYEYTDNLAAFSKPSYSIHKDYDALFIDLNGNICYLDNTIDIKIFECPLSTNLTDEQLSEFKKYVHSRHKLASIVTVDAGRRGRGIFSLFKRNNND